MKSSITKKSLYLQCSSIGRFVSLYTADATKKTNKPFIKNLFFVAPKSFITISCKSLMKFLITKFIDSYLCRECSSIMSIFCPVTFIFPCLSLFLIFIKLSNYCIIQWCHLPLCSPTFYFSLHPMIQVTGVSTLGLLFLDDHNLSLSSNRTCSLIN